MEEVDLKDLFSFLLKKIVFVFIISFLFLIAGIVYTLALKTPMYKGETTLVLAKKDDNINNSLTQNDITMNQKLVATYSVVVKSRQVVKQVIEELNLSYPVESLQNKISVTSVNDTEVIKITVIDKDSKQAAKIANTIASVFKKEIVNITIGALTNKILPAKIIHYLKCILFIWIGFIISFITNIVEMAHILYFIYIFARVFFCM